MKPQLFVIAMSCVDGKPQPVLAGARAGGHTRPIEARRTHMFDCSEAELSTLLAWLSLARI